MDVSVLRKRLNTFKSGKSGMLRQVSDEVVMAVLRAWENWPGSTADLYREIGLSKMQMAIMIKKGKKLVRSGVMTDSDFTELKIDSPSIVGPMSGLSQSGIELTLATGGLLRFSSVDVLIEFLKRSDKIVHS